MTFKEKPLVELCEIVSSKRVFAASYQSEGVPFFRGKEVSQLARGEDTTAELYISNEVYNDVISRTGPINSGDILLTAVGTLGNPYQVKETDLPFYFKDGNIVWLRKFSKEINSTYLFYWLNSEYGRRKILDTAIGSTQAALTITGLAAISISCPSLAQQTGIVGILSAIDQKITINNVLSKTLEGIAQTIFKSWFIDFDPVKSKMTGGNPEGMDAATAALFPDSMADSELGLIPKGWHIACIGDISSIHGGKMLSREEFSDDGMFPIFGGAGVMGNSNRSNAEGFVITLGRVGAYCGQFFYHRGSAWVNNNASRIIPQESISGEWMYQFLKSFDIESIKKGAAQPFVSNSDLANSKLLVPIPEVIQRFTEVVGPIFEQSETLKNQARLLSKLRDSLIPRLISGELQIPEEMLAS